MRKTLKTKRVLFHSQTTLRLLTSEALNVVAGGDMSTSTMPSTSTK